jgi:hypothetical protein
MAALQFGNGVSSGDADSCNGFEIDDMMTVGYRYTGIL